MVLLALATLYGSAAVPAAGQRPSLGMLDRLQAGRWELRQRDAAGTTERICLQDARRLIQLRHRGNTCERRIIDDGGSEVTVQYTCPGRGYGRTHIRRETDQLLQLDTQGIADGLPFALSYEGRRVGDCAG